MQVRDGHLSRRNEEQIVRRRLVCFVLELGDLAGALHHLALHDERRLHLNVGVLAGVEIEHEGDQRAYEL